MTIMRMYQTATYWYPLSSGAWGDETWSDPEVLDVRWQETVQLVRSKQGEEVVSAVTVYTTKEVDVNGRLQEGDVTGSPSSAALEPHNRSRHVRVDGKTDHWKVFL